MGLLYLLQKFYLRTSRQMRHLDLEAKSPLYTHFTETLGGLATVRAFGWKKSFLEDNHHLLNYSQKPYYLMYCIQRWLNVVLDLIIAGIATLLVAFAVLLRSTTSEGAIGLAMVNIINFNISLSSLINSWTQMETSLGAISRLKIFMTQTPKEDRESERQDPPPAWPTEGAIEMNDVVATYRYGKLHLSTKLHSLLTKRPVLS
jgi:ATP-binding cassette, subfamily C (CFTR/MRP), member 1